MRTLAIICLILAAFVKIAAFLQLADKKLDVKTRVHHYLRLSIPAYVLLIPVVVYIVTLYLQ